MTSPSSLLALEGKLTKPQVRALQWLLGVGEWRAAWWSGSPHTRWPKEMRPKTYGALRTAGLIDSHRVGRLDVAVRLTDKGRASVSALKGAGE